MYCIYSYSYIYTGIHVRTYSYAQGAYRYVHKESIDSVRSSLDNIIKARKGDQGSQTIYVHRQLQQSSNFVLVVHIYIPVYTKLVVYCPMDGFQSLFTKPLRDYTINYIIQADPNRLRFPRCQNSPQTIGYYAGLQNRLPLSILHFLYFPCCC